MQTHYSSPPQAAAPAREYVVGRRFLAHLIDVIILGIFQYLLLLGISAMGLHSSGTTTTPQGDAYDRFVYWLTHLDTYAVLQIGVITILPFVYFILMEAVQGATVVQRLDMVDKSISHHSTSFRLFFVCGQSRQAP
jgi:hypothetical protein